MNKVSRLAAVCLAIMLLLSACVPAPPSSEPPFCDDYAGLILEAQSVPTAQLIPCLESLPLGWDASFTWIDSEGSTVMLDSELAGTRAVEVEFTEACDLTGYMETQTDEVGTQRFELADSAGEVLSRVYVFDGGCTNLIFDFDIPASKTLVGEVGRAVNFVPRSSIAEIVRLATDGREQLDPPAG